MQFIKHARPAEPVALIIAGLLPTGAFAHEHRDIDNGKYTVVVGWDTEPAYQGQPNAATVRISMADADMGGMAMPVQGAERSLRIQIHEGEMTMELLLHAVSGKPGSYAADITPDRAGDVQWTLDGSINGDAVSELFDSADGKFDAVKPATTADAPVAMSAETGSVSTPAKTDYSAALDTLDASGLHDLDMSLEAGTLPSDATERVHQAQLVMTTTAWPVALQGTAGQLTAELDQVHAAIEANNMDDATQSVQAAHALYHQFESQARAWLATQAAPEDSAAPAMPMMQMGGSTSSAMATDQP
jgi:hypothetical protein